MQYGITSASECFLELVDQVAFASQLWAAYFICCGGGSGGGADGILGDCVSFIGPYVLFCIPVPCAIGFIFMSVSYFIFPASSSP